MTDKLTSDDAVHDLPSATVGSLAATPLLWRASFRNARWRKSDLIWAAAVLCIIFFLLPFLPWWIEASIGLWTSIALDWILFGIVMAVPLWLVIRRSSLSNSVTPRNTRILKEFAIAIPVTIVAFFASWGLMWLLTWGNLDELEPTLFDVLADLPIPLIAKVIILLSAVTIGPLAEELFCRGLLYNALRQYTLVPIAAAVQAFIFTLWHDYGLIPSIDIFIFGLLLVVLYKWRKTILAPIFVHCMFNFILSMFVVIAIIVNFNTPMLGIVVENPEAECRISSVFPTSGADRAGLQVDDVIIEIAGQPIERFDDIRPILDQHKVGDEVSVVVRRGEEAMRFEVKLQRRR